MNFVRCSLVAGSTLGRGRGGIVLGMVLLGCTFLLWGCGDNVRLPAADQLAEFHQAAPLDPVVDVDRLVRARLSGGAYRVLPREVLELTMPAILQVVTAQEAGNQAVSTPYICRIGDDGTIALPVIGPMPVAGRTLSEIEAAIVDAYHPKYTVTRPSVFARIMEYREAKVTITGAVVNPGVYPLKSDQMSVVSLIMAAGGIDKEGAAAIRILRAGRPTTGHPTIEETTNQAAAPVAGPTPDNVQPQDVDVVLSFDMASGHTSTGDLTVEHHGDVIVLEGYDLKNAEQLAALKAMLNERDSHVAAAVDQKLDELIAVMNGREPASSSDAASDSVHDVIEAQAQSLVAAHEAQSSEEHQIVLPVRGMNIPFSDVVLVDGDTVIVERLQQPLFTVLGLVSKPGNFPYPSHARYNLMQALGFAQGLDPTAEPRYATVYRMAADGDVVSATFKIVQTKKGPALTESMSVPIKPGDIVAVEHTPRTRANVFFDKMFRISLGAYIPLTQLDGSN